MGTGSSSLISSQPFATGGGEAARSGCLMTSFETVVWLLGAEELVLSGLERPAGAKREPLVELGMGLRRPSGDVRPGKWDAHGVGGA